MTAPVFVDTNVIVYRFDTTDPRNQSRADDWFTPLWNRRSGRVSFQVLQEAYAVLTRKLKPAIASGRCTAVARRRCRTCPQAGAVLDRNPNDGLRKPDLFAGGGAIPFGSRTPRLREPCPRRVRPGDSNRMNEGNGGQAGCA